MGIHIKDHVEWGAIPRFWWSKAKGKTCPSVLIKCGDCGEKRKGVRNEGVV
jgi:hypothetical protein